MPPRTTKTATAKLTIRLSKASAAASYLANVSSQNWCRAPQTLGTKDSQNIREIHGGFTGEMWEPQFDDGARRLKGGVRDGVQEMADNSYALLGLRAMFGIALGIAGES